VGGRRDEYGRADGVVYVPVAKPRLGVEDPAPHHPLAARTSARAGRKLVLDHRLTGTSLGHEVAADCHGAATVSNDPVFTTTTFDG